MERIGPVLGTLWRELRDVAADGVVSADERLSLTTKLQGQPQSVVEWLLADVEARAARKRSEPAVAAPRDQRIVAWHERLGVATTAKPALGEIARTIRNTPTRQHMELARTLFQGGVAQRVLEQPDGPERRTILAFLRADRQRVLLAAGHEMPAAFFDATALSRLRGARDITAMLTGVAGFRLLVPEEVAAHQAWLKGVAERFWRQPDAMEALREPSPRGYNMMLVTHAPAHFDPAQLAAVRRRDLLAMVRPPSAFGLDLSYPRAESPSFFDEVGRDAAAVMNVLVKVPGAIRNVRFADYQERDVIAMLRASPAGWSLLPESQRRDVAFQRSALRGAPSLITVSDFRADLRPETLADRELAYSLAPYDGVTHPPLGALPGPDPNDGPHSVAPPPSWTTFGLASREQRADPEFLRGYIDAGGSTHHVPPEAWTPELALLAVAVRGSNLTSVPRALWTEEVVSQALRYEHDYGQPVVNMIGTAIADWPPLADRDVQERLVRANAHILPWVDASLASSLELGREIAARQPDALEHFAPSVRHDPTVLAHVSDLTGLIDQTVDLTQPELRSLIGRLLRASPQQFWMLPSALRADPEQRRIGATGAVMLKGMDLPPIAIPSEEAVDLARINVGMARIFSDDQLRDPELLARVVREFPPLLDDLPDRAISRQLLLASHPELEPLAQRYRERLARAGITDAMRFQNRATLDAVLAIREGAPPTGRPRVLVIGARSDHNGSLRSNLLPELARANDVHYFEVQDQDELIDVWRRTALSGAPLAQVILAGHGARQLIALQGGDPRFEAMTHERYYIDLKDAERLRQALHGLPYAPGASIFLQSCSVGRGRDQVPNIATMMARSTGLPTHSYVIPSSGRGWLGARPHFRAENPFTYYLATPNAAAPP